MISKTELEILLHENRLTDMEIDSFMYDAERVQSLLSPPPENWIGRPIVYSNSGSDDGVVIGEYESDELAQFKWNILHCAYALQNEFLELSQPDSSSIPESFLNSIEEYGDIHFYLCGLISNVELLCDLYPDSHPNNLKFEECKTDEWVKNNITPEKFTYGKSRPKDALGKNIEVLTDSIKKYVFYHGFNFDKLDVEKILLCGFGILACLKADYVIGCHASWALQNMYNLPIGKEALGKHTEEVETLTTIQDKWDYTKADVDPYVFLIQENKRKLSERFPDNAFSEQHSEARLDKA